MIHRYELKFRIGAGTKIQLLESASSGLVADPHGHDGVYRVTSQYYDSPDLRAFWEKLDGVRSRRKFRLRTYGTSGAELEPTFFEIKHRLDQTVFKERVELAPEGVDELLNDPSSITRLGSLVQPEFRSGATVGTIERAAAQEALAPVNVIGYRREAWVGRVDQGLRVTFDHLCQAAPAGELYCRDGATPIVSPCEIILEVKFNGRLPVWLRDRLARMRLTPVRFSKYAEGVQAHEDLPLRVHTGALGVARARARL